MFFFTHIIILLNKVVEIKISKLNQLNAKINQPFQLVYNIMTLKFLKPINSSQRGTVKVDRSKLWKGKSYKPLVKGFHSTAGRNNQGFW